MGLEEEGGDWKKRKRGEWGLTEQKNEGDASPTGRSIGENGSRSSAFPGHSTFPVWEIGCRGGVSVHVECSGATGGEGEKEVSGPTTTRQEKKKLTKAERKAKLSTRNRDAGKRQNRKSHLCVRTVLDEDWRRRSATGVVAGRRGDIE